MWIDKGDIVTFDRGKTQVTGRVIRICVGCPRAVVRYLQPGGSYHFVSEQIHFEEMRHATPMEKSEFFRETRRRMMTAVPS